MAEKGSQKRGLKSAEKSAEKNLSESAEKIILCMKNNSSITIAELCKETGLSDRGVRKNIEKLKANGYIRRVGPDKGGHWEMVDA